MAKTKRTAAKSMPKAPISSNSTKAKQIIRKEIKDYYSPQRKGGGRSALDNMKADADSYNGGYIKKKGYNPSDYTKGAALVDAACFAVWEQVDMLSKIYGEKVKDWTNDKKHEVYKHLIGREYSAMLSEREKAKAKKAEERAKKKEAKAAKKKGGRNNA